MIKLVYCITKKAGLTDEEFFRYWENIHGPIGVRIPRLRKLVQSHRLTVPGDKRRPDYDGVAELWFDNVEALLAARQSQEWKASTEGRKELHRSQQSCLLRLRGARNLGRAEARQVGSNKVDRRKDQKLPGIAKASKT